VTEFGAELDALAEDLRDTLRDFRARQGFGRAIAAPQIGVALRVIYAEVDAPLLLVNPAVRARSRARMTLWDDCFSFPDLLVRVRRNRTVTVDFRDGRGAARAVTVSGPMAELLQHETDHLDGILAVDRTRDSRDFMLRAEFERQRRPPADAP
jgi:peptide deformylase